MRVDDRKIPSRRRAWDRMVLTGSEKTADGKASLLRGIWWVAGKDVRSKAERSSDGGKTWAAVFDIVFRPHRP